jgi:hypothetical protein
MDSPLTRRNALKGMISAGTLALIQPTSSLAQEPPISLSSGPIEIA